MEDAENALSQQEKERLAGKLKAIPRYAISPNGNVLERPDRGAFCRFSEVLHAIGLTPEDLEGDEPA
jgi:hypothetical protein